MYMLERGRPIFRDEQRARMLTEEESPGMLEGNSEIALSQKLREGRALRSTVTNALMIRENCS